MAGRIDQSIGAPPTDQVYSEQLAMAGGGLLRLSVPESYLRAEQWTALPLVGLAVLLSVVVGTGVARADRRTAGDAADGCRAPGGPARARAISGPSAAGTASPNWTGSRTCSTRPRRTSPP